MLLFFTVLVMAVFYSIEKPFLFLVGASADTWPYAHEYLMIYLAGTLFVQLVIGLNSFITAQGKSKMAMAAILTGAIANIILDPIFIFGFQMGVKGAAAATVLSQFFSACVVMRFLLSKETSALLLFFPRLNTAALRIGAVFAGALTVSFWPRNAVGEMDSFRPTVWRLVLLTLAAAWTILSFSGVTTFIYSNF